MGKVEARKEGSDSVETFLVQLQVTLLNTPFPMSQGLRTESAFNHSVILSSKGRRKAPIKPWLSYVGRKETKIFKEGVLVVNGGERQNFKAVVGQEKY